mmetsp:Transcript_51619/g.116773  ORF Transcript_51619/g.116773 Transcript_51619/m.116773 type:complete len:265 (+) Transcript_51619:191-985(+)
MHWRPRRRNTPRSDGGQSASEARREGRRDATSNGAGGEVQLPAAAARALALAMLLLLPQFQPHRLGLGTQDGIAIEDGLEDVAACVVVRIAHRLEIYVPLLQVLKDLPPGWVRARPHVGFLCRRRARGQHSLLHHATRAAGHRGGHQQRVHACCPALRLQWLRLRRLLRPRRAREAGRGAALAASIGRLAEVHEPCQEARLALDAASLLLLEGPGHIPLVVLDHVPKGLPGVHTEAEDRVGHGGSRSATSARWRTAGGGPSCLN